MKVVLGADPHGTGRTAEELHYSELVFEDAYLLAQKEGAEAVFWLGDLLHFKHGLELTLLLSWSTTILKYRALGIETVMIPGNHDKPWSEEPDRVAIKILPAVVHTAPFTCVKDGVFLAFLPWYPPPQFKKHSWDLAQQAKHFRGRKFLFSHTPLAEGFVSASNLQIEQPIRIVDLHTEYWDKVFLGDYHAHQHLGPKITYLGAPRPTTFGDQDCMGYWLLEAAYEKWSFRNLPLVHKFPEYHKVTIGPFGPPEIPNYDKLNKYKVICATNWLLEMGNKYPGVSIAPLDRSFSVANQVRLSTQDLSNPFATFKAWLKLVELDYDTYYPIGEEYLKKCKAQIY